MARLLSNKISDSEQKDIWNFLRAAYRGREALIELGKIEQHERESADNYDKRKENAYSFNFSAAVIDLLTQLLFQAEPNYDLGGLEKEPQYVAFMDNCDLEGTNYEVWLQQVARDAAIAGHMIVVVDKTSVEFSTKQDELMAGVYPYVATYWPQDVLDAAWKRDEYGRPYLARLSVKDSDENIRTWTPEKWHVAFMEGGNMVHEEEGNNPLGEVPAVWFYNIRSLSGERVGVSDIKDIAYIDLSILKNLMDAEEVIEYAAFPMMRKPAKRRNPDGSDSPDDTVGPTAILEFDPENPDSKPDWLEAKVQEPISAITQWIQTKVDNIYRMAHLTGVVDVQGKQAPSGIALRFLFATLNSKLSAKSINVEEAERQIHRLWQKWMRTNYKISISRPRDFGVQELGQEMDNLLRLKQELPSSAETVNHRLVELVLPGLNEGDISKLLNVPE